MQALGWIFGEVHICGVNNRKQDKTEGLVSPSENLGRWHFPIDMSSTRVEISLGTNSIMTQKTENTINGKMKNEIIMVSDLLGKDDLLMCFL